MKVKDCFTSRWGNDGVLVEFDWSSLEIVIWAFLTKEPVLYKLLKSGQDMHRYIGGSVLNCKSEEVTKEQRSKLKPANFTLIYGGTDWNLVVKDGLEESFAKTVYDSFWALFPVARLWADNLMKELDANAYPTEERSPKGAVVLESYYRGITGRLFYFKSYPDKISPFCAENRIYTPKGFKFAEGMNYQSQSLATADIHMMALGHLFRQALHHKDKFLLINTIHDSVLLDVRKEHLEMCCNLVRDGLKYVLVILREKFKIEFDLALNVEAKVGNCWSQMEEYKF